MNIAGLLLPKSMISYLYEDNSIRQGIEKLKYHGYASMPVLTRDNRYVGTVTEGDFLWYFIGQDEACKGNLREMEKVSIKEAMRESLGAVRIDTNPEELFARAMVYDFVPVVDDRGSFIGIVKRSTIIEKLALERKQLDYEKIFAAIPAYT